MTGPQAVVAAALHSLCRLADVNLHTRASLIEISAKVHAGLLPIASDRFRSLPVASDCFRSLLIASGRF